MKTRVVVGLLGLLLAAAPWVPAGERRVGPVQPALIRHEPPFAYRIDLARLQVVGPSDKEAVSRLVLLEDGQPLPFAHENHAAITNEGLGRYSHWDGNVLLSTSDNSDPRRNGRAYVVVVPQTVLDGLPYRLAALPWLRTAVPAAGCLLLLVCWLPATFAPVGVRLRWLRSRSLPFAGFLLAVTSAAALLFANRIDVTTRWGRCCYAALAGALLVLPVVLLFWAWRAERREGLGGRLPGVGRRIGDTMAWLLVLAALVGAVEAAARVWPARTSLAIDPGSRFLWPEWHDPRNSLGCNDVEPGPKTGPRLLLLGDSYTEGAGVRKRERFSAVLHDLLRQVEPRLQICNAGSSGMDTLEEAQRLEKIGDVLQPDAVVVVYVLNDADGAHPPSRAPLPPVTRLLLQRCGSYAAFRAYWHPVIDWDLIAACHHADSPGWQRVEDGLDRIAAWCDRRAVARYLLVAPMFAGGTDQARSVMDQVVAAARTRGFNARSALDDFHGRWAELGLSPVDAHPGPAAHAIMAARLAEQITAPAPAYRAPLQELADTEEASPPPELGPRLAAPREGTHDRDPWHLRVLPR